MNRGRANSDTCSSRALDVAVQVVPSKLCTRTYNHMPKNTAMYVHTGGVSNAYSCIRMARTRVHGEATDGSNAIMFIGQPTSWVEIEKQRPVHREATYWVGMRPVQREATSLDETAETGSGVPQY